MTFRTLLGAGCAACALGYASARANPPSWPAIRPVQHTFNVPNVKKMNISLLIRTNAGVPLYGLFCAYPDNNIPYTNKYAMEYGVDYGTFSGAFECRLGMKEIGRKNVADTLLVEDATQAQEWPSRGRFFVRNIRGACADIRGYGAMRTFRLRGMILTLRVIDPTFSNDGRALSYRNKTALRSLKLRVTVRPSSAATRSIAAIVPFPKHWPPECKLNLYFRNPATFSKLARRNPHFIDWRSVPITSVSDWTQGLQVGGTPRQCDAQFHSATTFRGRLVATRLRGPQHHVEGPSTTDLVPVILLRLDRPITICRFRAPDGATTAATQEDQLLREEAAKHHARLPVTFISAADATVRKAVKRMGQGEPQQHVIALYPSEWDLAQFGADEPPFVGGKVEIQGFVSAGEPRGVPAEFPFLVVEGICRLENGKRTDCLSFPGWGKNRQGSSTQN